MATVTYRGPRPELFISMPNPTSDVLVDRDGNLVGWDRGEDGRRPRLWTAQRVRLDRDRPTQVGALFALGLAVIRRRPGPWFEVRLHPGEWAEVCARVHGLARYGPRMLATPRRRRLLRQLILRRWYGRLDETWGHPDAASLGASISPEVAREWWRRPRWEARERVLGTLQWSTSQVLDLLAGEQKVFIENDEVRYAPQGWRPATLKTPY